MLTDQNKNKMPQPGMQQPQITADMAKNATLLKCGCGGIIFNNGMILKRVSPLLSPSGQPIELPIQILYCKDCGKVLPETDPDGVLPSEIKSEPKKK